MTVGKTQHLFDRVVTVLIKTWVLPMLLIFSMPVNNLNLHSKLLPKLVRKEVRDV